MPEPLEAEKLATIEANIRVRCGNDLAILHEVYRDRARLDFEGAQNDEQRIRAQALSIVHRDMAAMWRGDHERAIRVALQEANAATGEA